MPRPFFALPENALLALLALIFYSTLSTAPAIAGTSKTIAIAGHVYELELAQNRELTHKLKGHSPRAAMGTHFRGNLKEQPNSWVRVSDVNNHWQGVVSLGGQLFVVDELPDPAGDTGPARARARIADLSATSIEDFEAQACGTPTVAFGKIADFAESAGEGESALHIAEEVQFSSLCATVIDGVCLIAELELAFDLDFQNELGGSAAASAVSMLNIVEGFYRNDFNIAFEALSMEFLDSEIVSTTTNASDLLADVRSKKQAGSFSFIQNPQALFHFVTGRDLDGGTAGIAYVGGLCDSNWGVGLSQLLTSTSLSAVIMAHELGHNFGASHDGSGNACGNGFIMQSTVNSSTNSFSSCSISTITAEIEQLGNPAQCFNFAVDAGISASANNPDQVNANQEFTAEYTVTANSGYEAISTLVVNGSVPAAEGQFSTVTLNGLACTVAGNNLSYSCSVDGPPSSSILLVNATATGAQLNLTHVTSVTASSDVQDVTASNDQLVSSFSVVSNGAPEAPTGLSALQGSGTNVELGWQDNSDDEDGFTIERRITGGSFGQLAQVGANSTSYSDTSAAGNTSYEYRVIAFNGSGDSTPSASAQISVLSIPAAPSGLGAAQGAGTHVNLTWQDNSTSETGFIIERRVSGGSFSQLTQISTNITSYTDTTSVGNTSYEYRIFARNGVGDSTPSSIAQISVVGPPLAPGNLNAVQNSGTNVDLSWQDNSSSETSFIVERRISGGSFSQLTQISANLTSYTDTTSVASTVYEYRVFARNAVGDSSPSAVAQVSVAGPPSAPNNLNAAQGAGTEVDLSWQDTSTNETDFILERRISGGSFSQLAQISANLTSYTDTTSVGNTSYEYRIFARNAVGDSPPSAVTQVSVAVPPAAPSNLNAAQGSGIDVDLSWQDNSTDENSFTIERRASGGSFSLLAQPGANATSYTDTSTAGNTSYEYRVIASNAAGSSTPSAIAQISVNGIPNPPSNLTANQIAGSAAVMLSWADNSSNETGFILERRVNGGSFGQLAQLAAGITNYTDTSGAVNTTYDYRISARNAVGTSAPSTITQISVTDLPPAAPSSLSASQGAGTNVNLVWQDNSNNETGFRIERRVSAGSFSQLVQLAVGATSYIDASSAGNTSYEYRVIAINAVGNSSPSGSAAISVAGLPAPPVNLSAVQANSSTNVILSWQDSSTSESGFSIERRMSGGSFGQIAQVGAGVTGFTDTTAQGGNTYQYRIASFNAVGSSAPTAFVQVDVSPVTPLELPPQAPSNLDAAQGSGSNVNLAWQDNSNNEDGFTLERSENGGSYLQVAQVAANVASFTDTSAVGNSSYAYRVAAFNGAGSSAPSTSTLVDIIVTLPLEPSNLVVSQGAGTDINLNWQDNSDNESGFRIIRREVETGSAQIVPAGVAKAGIALLIEVSANVTSYIDQTNASNVTYEYEVTAFNSAGESSPSVPAAVTVVPAVSSPTPSPTPTPIPTANNSGSGGGGGGGSVGWLGLLALGLLNWFKRRLEPVPG